MNMHAKQIEGSVPLAETRVLVPNEEERAQHVVAATAVTFKHALMVVLEPRDGTLATGTTALSMKADHWDPVKGADRARHHALRALGRLLEWRGEKDKARAYRKDCSDRARLRHDREAR